MSSPVTMSGGRKRRMAAMRAANISVNANSSVGSGNTVTVGSNIGNSSSTSKGGNATAKGGKATSTSGASAGKKEPIRKRLPYIGRPYMYGGGRGMGMQMAGITRPGMRMMGGMRMRIMRGTMRNNRGGGRRMNMRRVYYRRTAMTNRRRNVMRTNRGRRPMMRSRR